MTLEVVFSFAVFFFITTAIFSQLILIISSRRGTNHI